MTAKMSRQLESIHFGIERVRALGVSGDELSTPEVLKGFCFCQNVLLVHRRPGRPPNWKVITPNFSAAKAIDFLLTLDPGTPS